MNIMRNTNTRALLAGLMLMASTSLANAGSDDRKVVQDQGGQVVQNTFGNCVRSDWAGGNDVCAPPAPAPAPAPAPKAEVKTEIRNVISKEERPVYFDFNQTTISLESEELLNTLTSKLKADSTIKEAKIVGYADRIGSESYNEKLSQKRANNVKDYIVNQGFVKASVADTRWYGETMPATTCGEKLAKPELVECLKKDRKVEVEIEYETQQQISLSK